MRAQTPAWQKYQKSARQFDAVLEHAKAVSSSLVGLTTPSQAATYGEQIFATMLGHCVTLRRIAPNPWRSVPDELWDLSSMCAIARCVIEAHGSFMYIAAETVPAAEGRFRISLWELHDKTRRLKMLEALGSTRSEVDTIRSDVAALTDKVVHDTIFQSMGKEIQQKVNRGDPPDFHLSQRARCQEVDLNFDYYNVVTMQLSQYVHALPFAQHQLFAFQAGDDAALGLMSLPLDYVVPFLGRVTTEMRLLSPKPTPDAPARTAKIMAIWAAIYERGVKAGQA